ncbi:hypothetical protein HYPDE_38298 [Hyphomicrobium denitrificans 1NES1]|uniref:DUF3300 domain-containing protein n=1 Tax=Hyphomicrobium denitrificans 1NES1 TaxID=670307 RepID=N0BFT4_9HYPH|nr:hypothetical protein HYPDE_38298 [Hyphomicrobium denitrificans 1NES1]
MLLLGWIATPVSAADEKLSKQQLDQLLAPIALYPDDLLTNVLMASTYPVDVVEANRWITQPENAQLKGDALAKAIEGKDWDPSIKALVQFPSVLATMSDKLDWTQKVGDAFLNQQDEVMDQIQFLRSKADSSGNLKSNKQQKVSKQTGSSGDIIVIDPATPDDIYVPVYDPAVVYGSWWYPDYPPYVWTYPGVSYVDGWWWGAGVAIVGAIWGWNHWDWHRHNIHVDVNRWNRINHNRRRITSDRWRHNGRHQRRATDIDRAKLQQKFKGNSNSVGSKRRAASRQIQAARTNKSAVHARRHYKRPSSGKAGAARLNRRQFKTPRAGRPTMHRRPTIQRRTGGHSRGGFRRRR